MTEEINASNTNPDTIPLDAEINSNIEPKIIDKDEVLFRGFLTLDEKDKAKVLLGFLKETENNPTVKEPQQLNIVSAGIIVLGIIFLFFVFKTLISGANNGLVDNQDLKWITDLILKLYELTTNNHSTPAN